MAFKHISGVKMDSTIRAEKIRNSHGTLEATTNMGKQYFVNMRSKIPLSIDVSSNAIQK